MTNDRITQADKREVLINERKLRQGERQGTTYHAQAMAGLDEPPPEGRYAQSRYVTGSEPSTQYPAAAPPSQSQSDAGLEPPLNQDVNQVQPVGESWEIEASIAEQELGGPTRAMAPGKSLPSAKQPSVSAANVGSPSALVGDGAPAVLPPTAVAPTHSASVRARPDHSPSQPDDGLDVPRRADGMPLSSHAIADQAAPLPNTIKRKKRKLA
jgi:hypothetical protein